jgi:hypothetical protein
VAWGSEGTTAWATEGGARCVLAPSLSPVSRDDDRIIEAVRALEAFEGRLGLTTRIAGLEGVFCGQDDRSVSDVLQSQGIVPAVLAGALEIKRLAGQVNVAIHALGILLALPAILEPGETVLDLSLGAGNTGKPFDLETTVRVAEFKFINWRGGAESIRQNTLFVDLFHLAEAETDKRKVMYLTGLDIPQRFLRGGRSLRSIFSKHGPVGREFTARYGDRYTVVRDYWEHVGDRVELVDLTTIVPVLAELPAAPDDLLT